MSQCGEGVEDMSTNINPIIWGSMIIYQFNGIVGMITHYESIQNKIREIRNSPISEEKIVITNNALYSATAVKDTDYSVRLTVKYKPTKKISTRKTVCICDINNEIEDIVK